MDEIEEIKRRIDIVDFVSGYLTVKKAGANYRALCPFHHEKTPSLMISPEKQIWKCFGCNEGGDVFSFVEKMENLGFREALEMLAARAGVKLEKYRQNPQYQKEKDQKTRLFQINSWSARLFHEILLKHPTGKSAREYLGKRGLNLETIKSFMIGYAPSNTILKSFLKKKGYTDSEIQSAGGPDRFYRRIIFPIRDVMGNTLGFTGRACPPLATPSGVGRRATSDNQEPKYLNTPETIIFHKGRILYNLDKARGDIKLQKATVVVEGQMDVISSFQAGVKNVVATSGTALTEEHLRILYRYTPNIAFAFDADTAGQATAKKAYEMAIIEGMNVKMVDLGGFKDPGEMAAAEPKHWIDAVREAKPVIDWYFGLAFNKQLTTNNQQQDMTSQQKKEIAKELLPIIKKIPDTIEQAHYVGLLAKKLGISEQIIFEALNKAFSNQHSATSKKQNAEVGKPKANLSPEEILIGLMIANPGKIGLVSKKITAEDLTDKNAQEIYNRILIWYNNDKQKKTLNLKSQQAELWGLEIKERYPEITETLILDIIQKIKGQQKEQIKQHFAEAIRLAEEKGERAKLKVLMKEFQDAISK